MSSNVLTYIIEVQDKISDKLKTITIANEQQLGAWADVEKKINSANRSRIECRDVSMFPKK